MKDPYRFKFNVGYLHNLRISEFQVFINSILSHSKDIAFEEGSAALQLLEELDQYNKDLITSIQKGTKHPHTQMIREYVANLKRLMMTLNNVSEGLYNSFSSDIQEHARIIMNNTNHLKKLFSSQNMSNVVVAARLLKSHYLRDQRYQEAIEALDLQLFPKYINSNLDKVIKLQVERHSDKNNLKTMRKRLRQQTMFCLDLYLNQIQYLIYRDNQHSHKYYFLGLTIQQEMIASHATLKARATRSKKKREKEALAKKKALENKRAIENKKYLPVWVPRKKEK